MNIVFNLQAVMLRLFLALTLVGAIVPQLQAQQSPFSSSLDTLFSNDDEFLTVDQAFDVVMFQQNDKLEVQIAVADGYYLYRSKFKFSIDQGEVVAPDLPVGIDHEDDYFGVQQVYYSDVSFSVPIASANDGSVLSISYQGCAEKGLCYPPTKKTITLAKVDGQTSNNADILAAIGGDSTPQKSASSNKDSAASSDVSATKPQQYELLEKLTSGDNLALTLLAFFGLGVGLAFTPCVFPMYPILTGIIVGQGNNLTTSRATTLSFVYVQGMALTYTILGVVVALAGAQFQAAFQHPAVLIGLSVLFVFLALSMFGVINLAMPASWQQKLNEISSSQKGGSTKGVFSMGAISGLVASPCTTAPLTGALLYISQTGDVTLGALALYCLSLGMGLPLLALGSSGGKLLPKAGAWMNLIKNIFGLLLLAVPIFLLERFIPALASQLLWAVLLIAAATYFYVVNQTSQTKGFSYGVRSALIFVALFAGAQYGYNGIFPVAPAHQQADIKHFSKVNSLAQLNEQVAIAAANNQSVMLDLYADWCVACKEFEEFTFYEPEVQQALSDTVLIQIDLTDSGSDESLEVMQHFDVLGLPSILFFDQRGDELTRQRVTGFMGPKDFSAHLRQIL